MQLLGNLRLVARQLTLSRPSAYVQLLGSLRLVARQLTCFFQSDLRVAVLYVVVFGRTNVFYL